MGRSGGASGRRGGGGGRGVSPGGRGVSPGGRGVSPEGSERESRGAAGRGAGASRSQRVASLVRQAVAEILSLGVKDPRVAGVVITDIDLTGDLREARLYYFLAGDDAVRAAAAEGLARCAGYVRRELGQRVSLRVVPSVEFRLDTSSDYGARIDARLRELGLGPGARIKQDGALEDSDDRFGPDDGGDVAAEEDDQLSGDDVAVHDDEEGFEQDEPTEPGLKALPASGSAGPDHASEAPGESLGARAEPLDDSLGSLDDPTPAALLGEPYDDDDEDHTEPGHAISGDLAPVSHRGPAASAEVVPHGAAEPAAAEAGAAEPGAAESSDSQADGAEDEGSSVGHP